ncbi:hypothetical protein B0H13DRAFT_1854628 [Mycena leptocephala]|nr:hypothetical protein B0H13DRAFT_1854628 [Mycena leptocephala]
MADQLGTRAIHRLSGSTPNAYATKVVSSAEAQRQRVACEMGGERGDDGEEIAARRGNACERLAFVRLSRSTLICVQTLPEKIEHTSLGSLAQPCGALAGFHCNGWNGQLTPKRASGSPNKVYDFFFPSEPLLRPAIARLSDGTFVKETVKSDLNLVDTSLNSGHCKYSILNNLAVCKAALEAILDYEEDADTTSDAKEDDRPGENGTDCLERTLLWGCELLVTSTTTANFRSIVDAYTYSSIQNSR